MKSIPFIIILLTLTGPAAEAQDFIGLPEEKIREIMAADRPRLSLDNKVINNTYRYLKYSSVDDNETWVVFIDEKGRCNGIRITCDNLCYDRKIKELNELYRPGEANLWSYRSGGEEISVRLKKESWFFTVTYERTKQRGRSGNNRTA
ncbi:MAG: hypothetical protein ABR531_06940 [Bacteroidales bacterium]